MNFSSAMQEMLSPEDGKAARVAAPGKGNPTLKPLPEDALVIVPLRNAVLFPGVMSPETARH